MNEPEMQISLPPETVEELDRIALQDGVSREDVVREAVREFLYFRRSRDLRARMEAEAQTQGLFTDEQIFDLVGDSPTGVDTPDARD